MRNQLEKKTFNYQQQISTFVQMDIWNKQKRSDVMSKIRSKNTKPEIKLRKALFAKGFRYRVNDKRLPGKPDIVLPKYKTVIFVNGCFWHGHENCKYANTPKTNTEFWTNKIALNKERDKKNTEKCISMGWNVLTVWECEIQHTKNITPLVDVIVTNLCEQIPHKLSIKFYEEHENEMMLVAEDIVEYSR